MAQVRNHAFHESLGTGGSTFQHSIITNIIKKLEEIGPDPAYPEKPDEERRFIIDVRSFQSLQHAVAQQAYETIVLLRVMEGFAEGVVCVGYAVITGKGCIADSLDDEISNAFETGVKLALEEAGGTVRVTADHSKQTESAVSTEYEVVDDDVLRAGMGRDEYEQAMGAFLRSLGMDDNMTMIPEPEGEDGHE